MIATALLAVAMPSAALAQPAPNARPTGGQAVAGSAPISQSASVTSINQSSQRAVVNWQSFDVGSNQTVQVNAPNASAVTLMRVTGPDPSHITGKIVSNGVVIITNGHGMAVETGGQVDSASLVMSAPGISNRNFMAGRMVFDRAPDVAAAVTDAGTLTVKQAGLAALVAPLVGNAGEINARLGRATLAAAGAETIQMYGDGLVSVGVTKQVQSDPSGQSLVTNTGTIVGDGGTIDLEGRAADGIVQNLVDAAGAIHANTAGGRSGHISVSGVGGSILLAGHLSAVGSAGRAGGTIAANASQTVTVPSGGVVNVSGRGGGGTVALGTTIARALAGRQAALGGSASPGIPADTARVVTVAAGATVAANGLGDGNGGTVTLLSTQATTVAGKVTAKGGPTGGNGGVVEASSQQTLSLQRWPNVGAPYGAAGTLYFDPRKLIL